MMIPAADQRSRVAALAPVLVGLVFFVAAAASLALTRWSNGLATIWLPNAFLLAYLLSVPRNRWAAAAVAVFIAGALANWLGGAPAPLAVLFGLTNALEPVAIAAGLGLIDRDIDLERIEDLMRFAAAAFITGVVTAVLAAGAGTVFYGTEFWSVWLSWFCSSFLGVLIATPLLLIGRREFGAFRFSARGMVEAVAVLSLVAGAAIVASFQSRWPLGFALLPPIAIATFRLRALGAAASVLLVATIGTLGVDAGLGLFAARGGSFAERLTMLQFFLAVIILTALPVAAILSQRDRYAASLAHREAQLAGIVDAVSDVIFRTDRDGRWTHLNHAWEQLTGTAVEESIGRSVLDQVVDEDRAEVREKLQAMGAGLFESVRHQFRFHTASGDYRWGEVQARRLEGADGQMIGAAGIIVDISDRLAVAALADDARRRAEQDAEAALLMAATDELTGLASRRAFLALLDQQLAAGAALSVALFDIDHFKQVNDRFGHAVGDEVLRQISLIAQGCVRDRDLIGRLGGEEFAVLMPGASVDQAAVIGERIRAACAEADHPPGLTVTVSLGVAAAGNEADSSALLSEADGALYRAKFEGRNCLRLAA